MQCVKELSASRNIIGDLQGDISVTSSALFVFYYSLAGLHEP